MTKKLPLDDFRAVRHVLEPHEFALGEAGEDPPPSDLVEEETWAGITHLPDDVAIRTSSHEGVKLKLLYSLWEDWIGATGNPAKPDPMFPCMLDATDCFQCAHFDFLHGYYRAALANLRAALELVMIGAFGSLPQFSASFQAWQHGTAELGFTGCRKKIWKATGENWLFADGAFPAQVFKALCDFTHSRPSASDGALWQSNGPVYNNDAIALTLRMALRVYAICHLFVRFGRPNYKLPTDSAILFELDWLPDYADSRKAFGELFGAEMLASLESPQA